MRLGGNVVPEVTDKEHVQIGDAKIPAKKVVILDAYGNQIIDFGTRWWENDVEKIGEITYVGMEDNKPTWFVQKIDKTSGLSIRYATIINNPTIDNYSDAWSSHTDLIYGTYSEAF